MSALSFNDSDRAGDVGHSPAVGYRLKAWGRTNGIGSHYRVVRGEDGKPITFASASDAAGYARERDIDEYRVDRVQARPTYEVTT